MRRRQALALAVVGLGGCLSDVSPFVDVTEDEPTPAAVPTDRPEGTPRSPAEATPTRASPDIDTYPGDCPEYGDDTTVVCAGEAPDDVPLRTTASRSSVELPATVEFTLSNDTDTRLETNHYAAVLHKRVDGEWFRIAPTLVNDPLMVVEPGDRHTWSVRFEHDADSRALGGGADERRVAGLGGGRYAFGNDGWFAGDSYEAPIALATTFDVDAPPAELTTTGAVSEVSVDDDTVSARWSGTDARGDTVEATFVLRASDGRAEDRFVTEQFLQPGFGSLVHPGPLRDALALLVDHDVAAARLTGATSEYTPFGVRGADRFEYEGRTYETSVGEEE